MVNFILFVIPKGIAFSCGAGIFSLQWLIGTLVLDYVSAIFNESYKAPNGDFRKLSNGEFGASELNIKIVTVKKFFISAIFFGLGYFAQYLGWM